DQVYDTDSVLLVTVCLAIFTWPSTALASGLAGLQEFHKLNLINSAGRALGQILAIVAAVAGGAVWLVFLAREAMAPLQYTIEAVVIKRTLPGYRPRPWSFSRKMFRRIFGLSRCALISGIAGLLIYQTDKIIIGALIPAVGA